MGYPGSHLEKTWRNPKEDVAAFLQTYHNEHYLIINVSERPYTGEIFQRVEFLGWPDHHPPSLLLLLKCVQTIDAWLNADPSNVVAIHCMAGRGRTGTVIASYLLYIKMFMTAQDSLAFFASRRSSTGEGVGVPSQIRYVEYFQYIVSVSGTSIPMVPPAKKLTLKSIIMRPIPSFDYNGDFTPSVIIENFTPSLPVVLFNNQQQNLRTYSTYDSAISIDTFNLMLQGDIMIRIFSEGVLPPFTDKPVFRFAFHTFFIQNYICDFTKSQLDSSGAGNLKDERIAPDFCVRVIFTECLA